MAPKRKRASAVADAGPKAPRDAQRVQQLLEAMGVRSYEPIVTQQLLEFMHSTSPHSARARARVRARARLTHRARAPRVRAGYIAEVFDDALDYTEHAGRSEISVEDTRLAISIAALTGDIRRRPLPGMLADMAAVCNRKKLPETSRQRQLPGPRDSFVHDGHTRNWQVVVPARQQARAVPEFTALPGAAEADQRQRQSAKRIEVRLAPPGVAPAERAQPPPVNLQDILAKRAAAQPNTDYDDDDDMWDDEREA